MAELAKNIEIHHDTGNYMIREAEERDLEALIELYGLSDAYHHKGDDIYFCKPPQPPRSSKYILESIRNPLKVIHILEKDGDFLGFQETNIQDFVEVSHTHQRRTAFVVTIFIKEEVRGIGVGEKLCDFGIEWAVKMGAYEITGDVYAFNKDSLHYFLKNLKFKIRYYHVYLNILTPEESHWKPHKPSRVEKIIRKTERLIKRII